MMRIGINDFVRRQTPESEFSHYVGTFLCLALRVDEHFDDQEPGYRDGVVLVNLPPGDFRCGVVQVTPETELVSSFEARAEGEASFIHTRARGEKDQAVKVQAVLYHNTVLAEGNENSTDCEWEIVSINASITEEPLPMPPMTMARNFLQLAGGTKGDFSAEDFAKSIIAWGDKATVLPVPEVVKVRQRAACSACGTLHFADTLDEHGHCEACRKMMEQ
jgi:hypothetical protein